MAEHPFRIVNVFTLERGSRGGQPRGGQPLGGTPAGGGATSLALTGNPLCVFENAAALSSETMQALALQFNLSETTFILPAANAAARVRIFTPRYEMAFAGHPTLGTAHVCRDLKLGGDSLQLEMQAGVIPVRAAGNRWTLTAPSCSWRELDAPRPELAAALGLGASDIGDRPLWVKAGKEQLIVPLNSVDAIKRTAPDVSRLSGIRSEDDLSMVYVFAFDGPNSALARFFFPQGAAILEDPATGSATANFGGWCLAVQRALPVNVAISQGGQTGRPSSLFLEVDSPRSIHVSGDVVEIGRGTISL
jgi:PhzF family phenazine biosynthesis protein